MASSISTTPADSALFDAVAYFRREDPTGERVAKVLRKTFDQLYDGQHTGRYKIEQLYKTEKTHFGTLVEINLQREFAIPDGELLDYKIESHEVDCKYSFTGQWMLPPESFEQLVLLLQANDENSSWNMGVIRVTQENRRTSENRDRKTSLSKEGKSRITWLFQNARLQPNALLTLPADDVNRILGMPSGQKRVDELFRTALETRISRNIVATVAQQEDYMKRIRANGGARTNLASEGILILSGDYLDQRNLAGQLGLDEPLAGELISVKVQPATEAEGVLIDDCYWKRLEPEATATKSAPILKKA
ncbi:NaeI family type II restriction endonuclease [Arcanobacterium canis]